MTGHPQADPAEATSGASTVAASLRRWRAALVRLWWTRLLLAAGAGGALGGLLWQLGAVAAGGTPAWMPWTAALAGAALAWWRETGWPARGRAGGAPVGWMGAWRPRPGVVDTAVWVETGVLPWARGDRSPATRAALEGAGYALITAAEAFDAAPGNGAPALSSRVVAQGRALLAEAPLDARWRQQARQAVQGPVAALLMALALLVALLAAVRWRAAGASAATGAGAGGARAGAAEAAAGVEPPLGAWRVRLTPPAYAGLAPRQLGDTGGATVVAGTVVELQGEGPPPQAAWRRADGDTAVVAPPSVTAAGTGWRVRVEAPDRARGVALTRGGRARLFLLVGVPDSLPVVTLEAPQRDTVFATAAGTVPVRAVVRDDYGVRGAHVEVIVSAGEGERYTATVRRVGARDAAGARTVVLAATLELGALGLGPGDVVHLRAVARDGHPAAGREPGVSETRRFRMARRGERDSLAVEAAAPPPVDTSVLSQRMLLRLATALARQRPRLAVEVLRAESARLARDQARLRQGVGNVVFQRLGGEAEGEHTHFAGDGHEHGVELVENKLALAEGTDGPVVAINRPLLEAYNHMWDAGRALGQADPAGALAPMRRALAAIERARAAERVYLRGRPPTVIVDVARVRMAGRDTGRTAGRPPRAALAPEQARRAARLVAFAGLATADAAAAGDSVRLLRLEVLADAPPLAAALEGVARALAAGGADTAVTAAFVRARRALGGVARVPAAGWSRSVPP